MTGAGPPSVGVHLGFPPAVPIDELGSCARELEAAGAESLFLADHLTWPATLPEGYPYSDDGAPPVGEGPDLYDPWTLLGAAAATTTRLRLGTAVYVLPVRPPLVVARAVTTVDALAPGRVIVGAGAGWMREEFQAAGVDFGARGGVLDESLAVLRHLWDGGAAPFDGEHHHLDAMAYRPRSTSIRIEIGGESDVALRRAACHDGWIGRATSVDRSRDIVARLRELRASEDRGMDDYGVTVWTSWPLDRATAEAYAAAGVTRLLVRPWRRDEPWQAGVEALHETLQGWSTA